ncbi:MAG TPA: DOMON-like domain-containing protein [Sphingomicrobium sp.]
MPSLICHPDTPCPPVETLEVEVSRGDLLDLRFRVTGTLDAILWPEPAAPDRTDELWRHTCFEAFVAAAGLGYREINLSPSGQWAVYAFDAYRAGMRPATASVRSAFAAGELHSQVALDVPGDWQLGLSAVIELADGSKSYWALAHAPGPPDFHNRDCFTATLAAPDAS